MDIKAKVEELVERIKQDEELQKKFFSDPISAVEELIGIDLPNDQIEKLVEGIKAKLELDKIGSKLSGLGNALGGLFGK